MQKLLFMGMGFHAYDDFIIKELQPLYDVSYINLNSFKINHPYKHSFYKRIGFQNKARRGFENSIQKRIDTLRDNQFDIVFVIKGEFLNKCHLETIRTQNPNARYLLYLWDSWNNLDNQDVLNDYFTGNIYTFDSNDSEKKGFLLRPLFYIPPTRLGNRVIDLSFVGVNHSARYEWLSRIASLAKRNGLTYYFYLNVGIVSYYKYLYLTHRFKKEDKCFLKTKHMSFREYQKITLSSKVILDYPDDFQAGLTMRTIEALGMGAKLITTNKYIKYYFDIPKSLYMIVDKDVIKEKEVIEFVNTPPKETLPSRYSLHGFLLELGLC